MKKRIYSLAIALSLALTSMAQSINGCYAPVTGESVEVGIIGGNGICFSQLCLGTNFSDAQKVIDNSLTTAGNYANLVTVLNAQGLTVRNNNGSPYPAGYIAGYSFTTTSALSVSVLNNISVATYLNGVLQETKISSDIATAALFGGQQNYYLTFQTTKPFNEVRLITAGIDANALSGLRVYAALAFSPSCNYSTNTFCDQAIAGLATDVTFDYKGGSVGYTFSNRPNLIDGDKSNFASLSFVGSALSTATVGVLDRGNVYPAGYRAGFVLGPTATNSLLSLSVYNSLTIQTYLYGQLQETRGYSSGSGLLDVTVLTFGATNLEKKKVGFVTAKPFNEVRVSINQLGGLSLASMNIYYAFEEPQSCTDCKIVLGGVSMGKYSGTIQGDIGGIFGIGATTFTNVYGLALHSLTNTGNAVSPSTTDYATYYSPLVAGLASGAKLTVKNNGTLFKAGTTAGFNYSNNGGLLDISILNGISISTYNGTTLQETVSGSALASGTLLGSGNTGPTSAGFVTTKPFNAIQIGINDGLLYGGLGKSYNIYGAYVLEDNNGNGISDCQEACPGSLAGNTAPNLSKFTDSIPCGSTSYNLNTITSNAAPDGTVFTWHSGTPATVANTISGTNVAPGLYYAAFYDAAHGCYSPTQKVLISQAACPIIGVDLTPTIDFNNNIVPQGSSTNIAVYIQDISTTPTTGTVRFTIPIVFGGSTLTFDSTATTLNVNGNLPLDNNKWTVTTNAAGTFYIFTLNPAYQIAGLGQNVIGLVLANNSYPQGSNIAYNLRVAILPGSGGDTNPLNDANSATFLFP